VSESGAVNGQTYNTIQYNTKFVKRHVAWLQSAAEAVRVARDRGVGTKQPIGYQTYFDNYTERKV